MIPWGVHPYVHRRFGGKRYSTEFEESKVFQRSAFQRDEIGAMPWRGLFLLPNPNPKSKSTLRLR